MSVSTESQIVVVADPAARPAATTVAAVLEGGPADLPMGQRLQRTSSETSKLKVPFRGGWEHFERTATGSGPAVFRWVMRTRIAE